MRAWEDYGDVQLPDDAVTHVNRFNITAMGYYQLNSYLSLGVEPGFAKRGAACVPGWWDENPGFTGDTQLTLNYAELPLMVKGQFSIFNSNFQLRAKLGYGVAYMVSAFEEVVDLQTDEQLLYQKVDFDQRNLNRWDHGMYAGFGFGYQLGVGNLLLESTYFRSPKDTDGDNTSKNRSITVDLGYSITLSDLF